MVYGLYTVLDRKSLWQDLHASKPVDTPWVVMGDFNSVFDYDQRINGNPVLFQEVVDGKECFQELDLDFVRSIGQLFSWSNRGEGDKRIWSRIDHCVGNPLWFVKYTEVQVQYLHPEISDHSPLLIQKKKILEEEEDRLSFLINL